MSYKLKYHGNEFNIALNDLGLFSFSQTFLLARVSSSLFIFSNVSSHGSEYTLSLIHI